MSSSINNGHGKVVYQETLTGRYVLPAHEFSVAFGQLLERQEVGPYLQRISNDTGSIDLTDVSSAVQLSVVRFEYHPRPLVNIRFVQSAPMVSLYSELNSRCYAADFDTLFFLLLDYQLL